MNMSTAQKLTTEDLIGAEVIDALDGSFVELRLPDGRIVELTADAHTHTVRDLDRSLSFPVGELVVSELGVAAE